MERSSLLYVLAVSLSLAPSLVFAQAAGQQSVGAPPPLMISPPADPIYLDRLGKPDFGREQFVKETLALGKAAEQIVQLIDAGRYADVQVGASTASQSSTHAESFASQLDSERSRLGELIERGQPQVTVSRRQMDAAVSRRGDVVDVSFPAQFAEGAGKQRELLSFHFDDDQVWRLADYRVLSPGG